MNDYLVIKNFYDKKFIEERKQNRNKLLQFISTMFEKMTKNADVSYNIHFLLKTNNENNRAMVKLC